jgi:glucose/arabinose dehydrogenase
MLKAVIIQILLCLSLIGSSHGGTLFSAESEGMRYQVDEVVADLGIAWGLVFLGPGELLVTERDGKVKRVDLSNQEITELAGVPDVWAEGQGGLLDVSVVGTFSRGDWIYFTSSKELDGHGVTALARAHLAENEIVDWQELFVSDSATDEDRHFGSRIAFDQSGHVFFSIGDRGVRPNGQDRSNHAGSIIRLNLDGSVPEDNPFIQGNGMPEIWSYGHRNPQGLFWDEFAGRLWSNEHGPRGGDEINLIEAGGNYGWPVVSHGKEYWGPKRVGEATTRTGMIDPVKIYIPSIAPGSLLVYSGKAFPGWQGNLFSGALKLEHLNRVVLDETGRPVKEERLLSDLEERIRALVESPEGWLYLSTDSGRILCIKPAVP